MTIEQYLHGKVDFSLSDATVAGILFDRGISEGAQMSAVTERQRDLALADLYMFLATSSVSAAGEYESDGGWQRREAAKNVYNRSPLASQAKALYDKWGVQAPAAIGKITSSNLY